jgi:hypothetical protein
MSNVLFVMIKELLIYVLDKHVVWAMIAILAFVLMRLVLLVITKIKVNTVRMLIVQVIIHAFQTHVLTITANFVIMLL